MQSEQVSLIIPRPPTPPREACSHRRLSFIDEVAHDYTPTTRAKRVGWTELTEYEGVSDSQLSPQSSLQHLPPSADRKPVKSILKASTRLQAPHNYKKFATMLESIVQQLAGNDRASKIDSYDTLSQVLKASDDVPDLEALREKMGLLQQFIKRDCCTTDTGLTVRALTLLCSFLYKRAISDALTQEFTAAIVEHSIKAFEDPEISKEIVKYLMFVLSEQNFPAKTMNSDRVGRLIMALHNLNNNTKLIKGKSIAVGRVHIYRKLCRQSNEKMLANTEWLKDLLTTMISDSKEARVAAISFGFEASLAFGTEIKTSRAVMEIFQAESEENPGLKFISIYEKHLGRMARDKEQCASVPRIWSVVVVFLRCRPQQFEHWAYMKVWLKIIQQCFNCSDFQTRVEANYAWNRLVFATKLDQRTPLKTINILRTPLLEQLKRKEKKSSKLRKAALGSICNLLYYALRPTSMPEQLDLYWKELVVEFVAALIPTDSSANGDSARQGLADACSILNSLLDFTTPRVWVEERAMKNLEDANVSASELPALDSKWLRRSSSAVFPVLESLLEKLYWDSDDITTIPSIWKSYINSIASAAMKEVKVSNDTMDCVAHILNFLFKTWLRGPSNLQIPSGVQHAHQLAFIRNFEMVLLTTIEGLGVLPFTERLLSMSNQLLFIVIATPSQRPAKSPGEIRSPLHHLFTLLASPSPGMKYDGNFSQLVKSVLAPFVAARPSSRAKVELTKDLLKYLSLNHSEQSRALWRALTDFTTTATDTRDDSNTTANNNGQPLGVHYRNIVKVLEFGIDLSPNDLLPGWKGLFDAAVNSATLDAGDAGCATTIIEPLSRYLVAKGVSMTDSLTSKPLSYSHMLISKATYPKDRQALDAARKRLWGTAATSTKNGTFDPYDTFYEYVVRCLQLTYATFNTSHVHAYVNNISLTTTLLAHCPHALISKALARLQNGLGCWIEDNNVKVKGFRTLSDSITTLWTAICSFVPPIATLNGYPKVLIDLEPLLCAGLESRHKSIVSTSVTTWNSTFGTCEEKLEYPERLQAALLRLRLTADVYLPFFPQSLESEGSIEDAQPIIFAESQFEDGTESDAADPDAMFGLHPSSQMNSSPLRRILRETTPQVVLASSSSRLASKKRSREETPEMGKKKSRKLEHTPRLRHDDSQIQFQTIDSSPYGDTTLDSQVLTERQKEVKERQLAEAALFPDLRSSPVVKSSSRCEDNSELELPSHRSSSKIRRADSPHAERQTTPSLMAPADEDNFMTSSPTPTRSLNAAFEDFDPPSSPPQVSEEVVDMDDPVRRNGDIIPSSPPEEPRDIGDDTTTSVDPSAQIDPDAAGQLLDLSTFESTPSGVEDITMLDTSSIPKPSAIVTNELAAAEIVAAEPAEDSANIEIAPPGTPEQAVTRDSITHSPKTPNDVFVDAVSSPILSDNVFEDAVSSPRLHLATAVNEGKPLLCLGVDETTVDIKSSPFSELDESSILRVMNGIDNEGEEFDVQQSTADWEEPETKSPKSLAPERQPPRRASSAVEERTSNKHTPWQKLHVQQTSSAKKPSSVLLNTSSMPSLIPETPFRKLEMTPDVEEQERELDPDSTIIVDTSALDMSLLRMYKPIAKPKRTPRNRRGSTKRKSEELEDAGGTQGEVPDSRDGKASVSPKKRSPKIRRGRPARASKPAKHTTMSPELGPVQSFSSSMDFDSPVLEKEESSQPAAVAEEEIIEDGEFTDSQRDLDAQILRDRREREIPPTALESVMEREDVVPEQSLEISGYVKAEAEALPSVDVTSAAESDLPDADNASDRPSTSGSEIINEPSSAKEAPMSEEISSSAAALSSQNDDIENGSEAPDHSEINAEATIPPAAAASVTPPQKPEEAKFETVTLQSMKDKLKSLIADLGGTRLTREDVGAFEDLFMDAKEMLYRAGRKGRGVGGT